MARLWSAKAAKRSGLTQALGAHGEFDDSFSKATNRFHHWRIAGPLFYLVLGPNSRLRGVRTYRHTRRSTRRRAIRGRDFRRFRRKRRSVSAWCLAVVETWQRFGICTRRPCSYCLFRSFVSTHRIAHPSSRALASALNRIGLYCIACRSCPNCFASSART